MQNRLLIGKVIRNGVLGMLVLAPVCGLAYSTRSYVKQDHLIAQWDGIENAGRLQHDANAAYPVELVKGLAQDLTGTIKAYDNYFELGKGYLHFVSEEIATAVNKGHATIELVIAKNGNYVNNGGFVAIGKSTRGFWAYQQTAALLRAYSYHAKVSGEYENIDYNADGTNTVAFLLGTSTATSSYAANGVTLGGITRNSTDSDGDCYIGTIAYSWLNTKPNAKVFAIRIYDTVLTAEDLAANRAIDDLRFIRGCAMDGQLEVCGTPAEYGEVSPAYGIMDGLQPDAEVPCKASSVWTNADETVMAECVGYKLYELDEQDELRCIDEQPDTEFVYKHPGSYRMLEWQWQTRLQLQVTAAGNGQVEISDKWASVGGEVTLTATPDEGWTFAYWEGGVPEALKTNPHPTFEVMPGMAAFTAVFRKDCYVSDGGDDTNDGESWATAFKTLKRAFECHSSVNVHVGSGVFTTDSMLILTNGSSIVGSTGPSGEPMSVVRMTKQIGAAFLVSNDCSRISHLAITAQGNHHGRGVWLWGGGLVEDCVITNCVSDQSAIIFGTGFNNIGGGALLYCGGTLRNCLIANCSSTSGAGWHPGGGIGIVRVGAKAGGLVENCVVTNCFTSYSTGGGVYAECGVVRNTLIAGNTLKSADTGAMNLHLSEATAENCTIADGYYDGATTSSAVSLEGGSRLVNSIVYGNRSRASVAGVLMSGGLAVVTCCCTETETPGAGNVVDNPMFVDSAHGDYSIGYSQCVDAGTPLDWHVGGKDLGGKDRVMGSAVDMGCYEYEPEEVAVRFSAQTDGRIDRADVTFTAVVEAPGKTVENYSWKIVGADGSELTTNGLQLASFTMSLGAGIYGVELTVSVGGEARTFQQDSLAVVHPRVVYVSASGANIPPYADLSNGCTDLHAALEFVDPSGTILIAPGFYSMQTTLYLDRPVRLVGMEGPGTVTLHTNPKIYGEPMVSITDQGAWLQGVTVSGYSSIGERPLLNSCGILLSKTGGTVTNCVVDGVQGVDGPGIQQAGGLVVDTVVRNNSAPCQNINKRGGGVNLSGGLMTRCVITNNDTVVLAGSLGGGAFVSGGTLENSFVCGNECSGSAGGVCCVGGTVRNCLISDNTVWTAVAGVLVSDSGRFYNNTIVGNGGTNGCASLNAALQVEGATALVKNNIVWGNPDCAVQIAAAGESPNVSNNVTEDPKFKNVAGGDYRIGASSPAYGYGDASVWAGVENPVDLAKQPRLRGRKKEVDAGCYECQQKKGLVLLVW